MLNKTLLGLSLVAAFSTASLSVQADEYHVVVPAPGKVASYASIKLELNPASLPVGVVGDAYAGFDFNTALRITGDPALDMSQATWSAYSGALPQGLMLTKEGSVLGTPTETGTSSFQVLTKYKTKSAVGTYAVDVPAERHLVEMAGVRSWKDGTYAQSCKDYIQPTFPYVYAGATGDGVYRIAPGGLAPFNVKCDMSTDGGGWTLVEYAQDLAYKQWLSGGGAWHWIPTNFNLKLTDIQVNAIRVASAAARQRYVGRCEGVVHYYYSSGSNYQYAVGFRYHTGVETNYARATYTPATVNVVQDGCKANGGEGGQLAKTTIFEIENINLPVINIMTQDSGNAGELFGSPLTQYPARFR